MLKDTHFVLKTIGELHSVFEISFLTDDKQMFHHPKCCDKSSLRAVMPILSR